jgi:hypothetical protein
MSLQNLTQEKITELVNKGFTLREIQRAQYAELYRAQYNQKPEVKQKRREYNTKRYARLKTLREIAHSEEQNDH